MRLRPWTDQRPVALVVDDDTSLRRGLEQALSGQYRVLEAGEAPDAIDLLKTEQVSVLLLDIILAESTGFAVLDFLKGQTGMVPPVVIMSALAPELDLEPYQTLIRAVVAKPFAPDEMLALLLRSEGADPWPEPALAAGKARVLLVDDNPQFLRNLVAYLRGRGYEADAEQTAGGALDALSLGRYDAVVVDWIMPEVNGLALLKEIRARLPELPVLLMTGHGAPSLARIAREATAADVLIKPFPPKALPTALEKCLKRPVGLPSDSSDHPSDDLTDRRGACPAHSEEISGRSRAIRQARQELQRAAATDSNVLLLGETGTGKERFARTLHNLSRRAAAPFVAVNAAAIPEPLLESELFGYAGGAFTGARRDGHSGKFIQADGGTLFLDEVGDLPLTLQAKLLRVLEEGEVAVVGGATHRVDVRVVAATHRDLDAMVRRGQFRADLFYRLHVIVLRLPPLRERAEDIPDLAREILEALGRRNGRPEVQLSSEALARLAAYGWPGNVRELRNVLERALVSAQGPTILPLHLGPEFRRCTPRLASSEAGGPLDLAEAEKETILRALEAAQGKKAEAARLLGISRAGLYAKLKLYSIG